MHEIVKYFILTENQSHCFNRRFVIHSHRRSIRTGAPDQMHVPSPGPGLGTFSAISAFHCRFGTGGHVPHNLEAFARTVPGGVTHWRHSHDQPRHKIATHPKFSRHKITPQNQQFYLPIFYSSPSAKHATRHNFQPNHILTLKL